MSLNLNTVQSKREFIVSGYIHDCEWEIYATKHVIPDDLHDVVFAFYGKNYLALGIGDKLKYHTFGKLSDQEYNIHSEQIKILVETKKLHQLCSTIAHPFDIYRGNERLLIKDINGKLFSTGKNFYGQCGVNSKASTIKEFTAMTFSQEQEGQPNDPNVAVDVSEAVEPKKPVVTETAPTQFDVISRGLNADHVFMYGDKKLYHCGSNEYGQAGTGSLSDKIRCIQIAPDNVNNVFNNLTITDIKTGNYLSVFLCSNGDVYTCGRNTYSQCGFAISETPHKVPKKVAGLSAIAQISVGRLHTICLDRDNKMFVFGSNFGGKLGLHPDIDTSMPREQPFFNSDAVQTQGKIKLIECANDFSAVLIDTNVYLFGKNTHGEIGNDGHHIGSKNGTDGVFEPYLIPDFRCTQVSLGDNHTLLLNDENQLYACGNNADRQCSNVLKVPKISVPTLWNKLALGVTENARIVRVIANFRTTIIILD